MISFSEESSDVVATLPSVGQPNPIPNNPFSTKEGYPQILLVYNNNTYNGLLISGTFSSGNVNDNMPSLEYNINSSSSNITTIVPEQKINISQNEQIHLFINGNPRPELQPSSLSATVYHLNGTAVKILSLMQDDKKDKFNMDLDKGEYILLAVATWLPNSDNYLNTSGYVSYGFRISIV